MKFLKVLSTSAIAAAILASMSATAFADEFDDDAFGFEEEEISADEIGGDDDDDTFGDETVIGDEDEDTAVNDADGTIDGGFAVDTEDDDNDTFADDEEDATETADADFFGTGYKKTGYKYYSWANWDFSTDFWNSKEFTPAGVPATATVFDVVDAATAAGVNSLNIQSLSNFLILNEENFTSDDYVAFIAVCNAVKEEIIDEHVHDIWGAKRTAGSLSEEDRYILYNSLSRDEKDAISAALINVANAHKVLVSFDTDAEGYPVIYASMRHRIAATPTSSSTNTQVAAGSPVAATGGELPETGSAGAAAFASIALGLAAVGVIIVARKNKA